MPTQRKTSVFNVAKLTFALKTNAASTVDIWLSDRPVFSDAQGERYKPLLLDIRGIGNAQSGVLPAQRRGSIVIDCAWGTFGFDKRVVDFFERYTPINQAVELYTAEVEAPDQDITDKLQLVWVDRCSTFRMNLDTNELSIELEGTTIKNRVFTREITINDFPNAPSKSIGKYFPITFGTNIEVRPYQLDAIADFAVNDLQLTWGYGTSLSTTFPQGGLQTNLVKSSLEDDDRYVPVNATTSWTAPIVDNPGSVVVRNLSDRVEALAQKFTLAQGEIITSFRIQLEVTDPPGAPNDNEEAWTFHIWETGKKGKPRRDPLVSTQPFEMIDYQGNTIQLEGAFEEAVCLPAGDYYFGFETDSRDGSDVYTRPFNIDPQVNAVIAQRLARGGSISDGIDGPPKWRTTTGKAMKWQLYGVFIGDIPLVDNTDDATGLNYQTLSWRWGRFTSTDPGVTQPEFPDAGKLSYIAVINGIQDDTSGTITGTPNVPLVSAAQCVELLSYDWDGVGLAWVAGDFDDTIYAETHLPFVTPESEFFRQVGGRTQGRQTRLDLYRALAREFNGTIVKTGGEGSKIAYYADGSVLPPTRQITDDDAELVDHNSQARRGLLTQITALYDKRFSVSDFDDVIANGGSSPYTQVLTIGYNDGGEGQLISAETYNLFGLSELNQNRFDWITTEQSMRAWSRLTLRKHRYPDEFVRFRVLAVEYLDLIPFDTVLLSFPQLPSFGGSTPRPLDYVDSSESFFVQPEGVEYLKHQVYRAQIIDYKFLYKRQETLRLEITAKLLNKPGELLAL